MNPIDTLLRKQSPPSSIAPLFWQHGEAEGILREEIRQMHAAGIGGFIVESRPHPDFLGPRWWHDLDVILDQARGLGMQVWLFDDKDYPSGFAAGRIRDQHPEYLKIYLAEKHIDAIGPLHGSSFFIASWLGEGDSLVRVLAARQIDRGDQIDGETLRDLTGEVVDGVLYWDVPEGDWRVFIIYATREGGEEHTRDYLNPLEPEPTQAYLDLVYAEHYARYADDFGKTIAGFFTDEPRFGSLPSYAAAIGRVPMVLPYSHRLLDRLSQAWGSDFGLVLPALWYDAGPLSARARYTYMDLVSRAFGEHFIGQMGDWCRAHGVRLIGHVVEENGAHARLGYGAGHFFRAMHGLDCAGLDVVYHLWPGFTRGVVSWGGFTEWDARFAYWGMSKMASSAGHIDPKKGGVTVCEAFGAYGWQEGLKLMKWITDHLCVRGVNFFIPHAFSPKQRDPDCPPHFYARGENPQWPYFNLWSAYTNRVCHLLTGGVHVAPVAVLYHAEAEWAGDYEPFERVVETLALRQFDCDVLPVDILADEALALEDGRVRVNRETYRAVVIPQSAYLPEKLLAGLARLAAGGVLVLFMGALPQAASQGSGRFDDLLAALQASPNVQVCDHAGLVERLVALGLQDASAGGAIPDLRAYHYRQDGRDLYFFTNENRDRPLAARVSLPGAHRLAAYDALEDRFYSLESAPDGERTAFTLELAPYESLFVLLDAVDNQDLPLRASPSALRQVAVPDGPWQVSTAAGPRNFPFTSQPSITGLGSLAVPGRLPAFSGTARYETTFEVEEVAPGRRVFLDLGELYETGEVTLNGQPAGARICPPYRYEVTGLLRAGQNHLRVDVTNTLAKQFGRQTVYDRSMPQEPSGLLGPVRLLVVEE